jgi:hypothetical protein
MGITKNRIRELVDRHLTELEAADTSGAPPLDRHIIGRLAMLCMSINRVTDSVKRQTPEDIRDFAKLNIRTRERLGKHFKLPNTGEMILGFCMECEIEKADEGVPCNHTAMARATMLVMAMLRLEPEFDMDVTDEEQTFDDPNEGMISTEE